MALERKFLNHRWGETEVILYKILKLKAIKYVPVSIHMKRNEDFSALGRGAKFSTIPRKKILILLSKVYMAID